MSGEGAGGSSGLARLAGRLCAWAERWYPDAFIFAVVTLGAVALGSWLHGARVGDVAGSFGEGFWSLIPFTMQMCFIIIGGYVVADSPVVERGIVRLAALPSDGRAAVALVAGFGMALSFLHWGLGVIVASLLARALARRAELAMDYRAAAAAAYLGLGTVSMMGLSSSAAQLQANPGSMPPSLLAVTGVIPFSATILTWQSLCLALAVSSIALLVAWRSAPGAGQAQTARQMGIDCEGGGREVPRRSRPGDWLEFSPLPSLLLVALIAGWLAREFATKGPALAVSSLNTYNLLFIGLGLLLQWRPRRFLDAVTRSIPGVAGVLLLFPLYGGIAGILSKAVDAQGASLATALSHLFTSISSTHTYALIVGAYSAFMGLLLPSAGGKWIVEAPYVMQTANDLHYNLGWAVVVYNSAEMLPNLINPFWMLPILGVLGLKARDLIGYTALQFIVLAPVVLVLLWLLGTTFSYQSPMMPG